MLIYGFDAPFTCLNVQLFIAIYEFISETKHFSKGQFGESAIAPQASF
jgi:hypothetical protein